MKKIRFDKLALVILGVLVVAIVLFSAGVRMTNRYYYGWAEQNTPAERLMARLSRDFYGLGTAGFLETDEDWQMLFDEYLGETGNIVVVGKDGTVLKALNDQYLGGQQSLRLLVSPYAMDLSDYEIMDSNGARYAYAARTRLGVFVDEAGGVQSAFRVIHTNAQDKIGVGAASYARLFPTLNSAYAKDAIRFVEARSIESCDMREWSYLWDEWGENLLEDDWDDSPMVLQPLVPEVASDASEGAQSAGGLAPYLAEAEQEKVRAHMAWELSQMRMAGDKRLAVVPDPEGNLLMVFFRGDEHMYAAQMRDWEMRGRGVVMVNTALWLFLLALLLLALWVFLDAQKRNFHPAMWGILTLIGNVITLLIYLMARSGRARRARCERCGQEAPPTFAFCTACGCKLCEQCAHCKRNLRPNWRYCPDCGCDLHEPSADVDAQDAVQ